MAQEIQGERNEITVTPDNIEQWRFAVATLREKKGVEDVALQLISTIRAQCEQQGLNEHVVNLYWEESLVGQHLVMAERDKPESEKNIKVSTRGLSIMSDAALTAHKYIESHDLNPLLGASYRFLGRVATYSGDHDTAKLHYEKSLSLYKQDTEPIIRSRYIELQAFLCHALIMTGKFEEGLSLAVQTFDEAENSVEGRVLRQHDYYTWAIWTSGIPIHVSHAVKDSSAFLSDEKRYILQSLLDKASQILKIPKGVTTWGDERFQFRRDELDKIEREPY